jgi:predicted ATPase
LIVETHSELFALRIRRRVAEAKDAEKDLLKQTVGFVFAVRDTETATSRYENVEMTDDGGFEVWPDGFFDQQGEEAMEILKIQLGE